MAENDVNTRSERQINSNLIQTNSSSQEILTNNIYTPFSKTTNWKISKSRISYWY